MVKKKIFNTKDTKILIFIIFLLSIYKSALTIKQKIIRVIRPVAKFALDILNLTRNITFLA